MQPTSSWSEPLPPIDGIEDPSATFVAAADTAATLARAEARQQWCNRGFLGRSVVLLVILAGAGWLLFDGTIGVIVGTAIAIWVPLCYFATQGRRLRRLRQSYERFAPPGETLAVRFGPEAFEMRWAATCHRIRYSRIRRVTVRRDVVIVRLEQTLSAYPRELFSDTAIELLRPVDGRPSRLSAPPLPPFPPLTRPSSVFVAEARTIDELVGALFALTVNRLAATVSIGLAVCWLALAVLTEIGWATRVVVLTALAMAVLYLPTLITARGRMRGVLAGYALPGQELAVRLGPDAFDVRTDEFLLRTPYHTLRGLRPYRNTVVVTAVITTAYPRALLDDAALEHIRANSPGLLGKRDRFS